MKRHLIGALGGALLATACAIPRPASPGPRAGLQPFESDAQIRAYLRVHSRPVPRPQVPPGAAAAPAPPPPPCAALPGDTSRSISGTVTASTNGAPLAGAIVRLQGTQRQAVTDAAGRYRMGPVPAGAHTVTVSMLGHQPGSCAAQVAAGSAARADFALGAAAVALEGVVVAGAAVRIRGASSITNTQHAGVDEGGIVKLHGDHLVILRRGRLFTVRVGDAALRPVSTVDAFGPGIDPRGTWYDELLVSGSRVIVLGYSYRRGGTEIGLFDLDSAGRLRYRSTHHLRSHDYYSSRNYASRLVDGKLIFYAPLYVAGERNPMSRFPALRRWREDGFHGSFRSIASASRVYRPAREVPRGTPMTLHTVTVCGIAEEDLDCEATVVMAGWGRVFYVAPGSVYVWTHDAGYHSAGAVVYRIPLDGSRPSALGASGMPIDQFSFLEEDGHLAVLLRNSRRGESMWGAEQPHQGSLTLLRVPLGDFGDGSADAADGRYRPLPGPGGHGPLTNRFVGRHLLYGTGSGWGAQRTRDTLLHVVPLAGGEPATLRVGHGIDRIEVMGSDAVVVGASDRDLHFSGIRLGEIPRVVHRYVRPGASQGETRSHGFFYREDDERTGVLGLPIRGEGRPGHEHLVRGSASVLYLRNTGRAFWELGHLAAHPQPGLNDRCRASCVDWYGNARPIFMGERVFALLGYEIVEGRIGEDGIQEVGRISYAPARSRRSD